jgi:HEAT repeat protein
MRERIEYEDKVVPSDNGIAALVDALAGVDGVERQAARVQLQEIGRPAVPALLRALQSPSEHARWEAAKALGKITDTRAAPALVRALGDDTSGVRWLAATALINLGRDALAPLLLGLEGQSDSIWFRDGAHHVLRSLVKDGVADEAVPVLEALEDMEPRIEAPIAAYQVLQDLRRTGEVSAHGSHSDDEELRGQK